MSMVQIDFLPLIRKEETSPAQLLRVQIQERAQTAWEAITVEAECEGIKHCRSRLSLYRTEENVWIYRGWIPVRDGGCRVEMHITVLLPDGESVEQNCSCGMSDWQEICFTPITHHDLGYTHTIDELLPLYCRYYDSVLDFCDATAAYPEEAQYRYTVEQFWSLEYYLAHTTAENVRRLKEYVRQGRIEITATYANLIDAGVNAEELRQLLLPAMTFAEECGVRVKSAAQVDMPGLSSAVIRALCDAGIPYFFAGFPQYFGWGEMGMLPADGRKPDMQRSHWSEKRICPWGHPFACQWKADAGRQDSLFAWYQYGYGWFCSDRKFSDTNDSLEEIEDKLPELLLELRERGYPYPFMRYIDKGTDNQKPEIWLCDIVKQWNEQYLSPRLSIATNTMFFEKLESVCARYPDIQICGDMPHTDYTILAHSEAEYATANARSRNLLAATDRLYRAALQDGRIRPDGNWDERYRLAWRDVLLFDEHCFGMAQVTGSQFRYNRGLKMQYALRGVMNSEALHSDLREQLETGLDAEQDCVAILNPAAVPVPGVIRVFEDALSAYTALEDPETGQRYPIQTAVVNQRFLPFPEFDDLYACSRLSEGLEEITVVTAPLPPCGIKTFRGIREPADAVEPTGDTETEFVMESEFYTIRIRKTDGRVLSVMERERGTELLDAQSLAGFGRVILKELAEKSMHIPETVSVERRWSGPVAESILIRSADPCLPAVTTEILLYKTIRRIDISLRLTMVPCPASSVWVEFPFLAEKPVFCYGTPNGMVDLSEAQALVPGANTHQITFSGWCGLRDGKQQIYMASPEAGVVSFGSLHPMAVSHAHHYITEPGYEQPYADLQKAENGHLYALLAYSNARTNFSPYQSGQVIYRFSFTNGEAADPYALAAQVLSIPEVFHDRTGLRGTRKQISENN